ncbi:uncharacterized protein CLUP02_02887, partial [Colletotrichum lupini]
FLVLFTILSLLINTISRPRRFFFKLRSRIIKRKIINKKALEYFLYNSVKDPVKVILNELRKVKEVKTMFDLSNRIVFKNYLYILSNVAPEVIERNLLLIPPSILYNRRVDF